MADDVLGLLAARAVSYCRTRGERGVDFAVDPIVPGFGMGW